MSVFASIFLTIRVNASLTTVNRRLQALDLYKPQLRRGFYYMEESVLLGTKPLVDTIRHFIRDPSGIFSVCHLCECRIVQWCHDSHLLLLLNWFLHVIKRTLHVGSKIWILCSLGKSNISRVSEQEQYLSRSLRSLVRYCLCHSNIKFISSRHPLISSIYFSHIS